MSKQSINHLDFPWKDITDLKPVCEMTIDALKIIENAENSNRNFFSLHSRRRSHWTFLLVSFVTKAMKREILKKA